MTNPIPYTARMAFEMGGAFGQLVKANAIAIENHDDALSDAVMEAMNAVNAAMCLVSDRQAETQPPDEEDED